MELNCFLIPFLVCLLSQQCLTQELQCNVEGQCTGINFGSNPASTYDECLNLCKKNPDCHWFTFLGDTQECIEYDGCPILDTTNCNNCFSGQEECPALDPICNVRGTCNGHFVAMNDTETSHDCLIFCQSIPECQWYSFFTDSKNCILTADCLLLDDSCTNCLTGERSCPSDIAYTKLLVVGGISYSSEMVDLSSTDNDCPGVPGLLDSFSGTVGTYFTDIGAMVCGGTCCSALAERQCYTLSPKVPVWQQSYSMVADRKYAAAAQISATQWWVTGGIDYNTITDSTEIFTVGQGFSIFVPLPFPNYKHSLVAINSTHFMMLGGLDVSTTAWMFNMATLTWTQMPNSLVPTYNAMSGLITYSNGTKAVILAGGGSIATTQIFSLESMTWRRGTDFPVSGLQYAECVQKGNTFLAVGGLKGGWMDTIYEYEVESGEWLLLQQKLDNEGLDFSAILVPDDFAECRRAKLWPEFGEF